MRQGQGSKRSRGRGGGRRNTSQRHQNFDSNGPSIRIRGNAHQVYEKYLQLARDANAAGDRVMAENMFQHAEHYFRILNTEEKENQQARLQNRGNNDAGENAQSRNASRGNGADHRNAQRQPREDSASAGEDTTGAVDGNASDDQPASPEAEVEAVGASAQEEENAPKRPQRRGRRGNGRAQQRSRENGESEASESAESSDDAAEIHQVEFLANEPVLSKD